MNDLIQINVAGPDTSTGRPCTRSKKHKGNSNGQNDVRDNKAKSFVQGWKDIAVAVREDEPAKKAKGRNPADCTDRIDLPKGVVSQQGGKEMRPTAVVPAVLDVPLGAAARAKLKMKERLSMELYIRIEEALRHIKLLGLRHDEVRFRTVPGNPKDVYLCRSFKGKEGERDVEDTIKLALVPRVLLGAAAFVLPNPGGNKKADITEVRSIRAEWDDQPIEWQIRAWEVLGLPEPTFQVATGGKSVHSYWVLREAVEPIRGELAARRLVKLANDKGFPSDPAVVGRSQPMRLAGSLYISKPAKKGEPVNPQAGKPIGYAQILDGADPERRYSIEELEAVLPKLTKVESEAVGRVRAAAGDVSHSGEEDPCPICGRDSDADCTIFDNTDGVVVVVCYRGKSFSPPTDLTLGDVIEGKVDPSTRWAYTGESAMGSFGRPAAKFKQVGPEVALHNAKQEQQALTEALASPRPQQDAGAVASPPEKAPTQVEAPALVVTGNPDFDWETAVFWAESVEERAALMAEGFALAEGMEGKDIKGRTVFLCWSSRAMVKVPKALKDLALMIAGAGGNPQLIHLPCEVPQARGGLDPDASANTPITFLKRHGSEALLLLADRAELCCERDDQARWKWMWSREAQEAPAQAIIAWSVFKEHYVVEGAEERLYEWDGDRWVPLPGKASTAIEQPLQRWVGAMQWRSELTLGSKATTALIAELRDHPRRRALCLDPVVQHGVLPMRNGVVRLSDGVLMPHDRKYGNTWVLPYEFRPDELPVKTLACINRLLPKPHHQRLFRAACANALRRLGAKGFVELTGVGDSGKSALARLVEALVGKECTASSQLHLMEDKNQRFETLKARGAALLLFAECQDYAGPLERLKAFTGGDTIVAERKNSTERFDFTFRGLVMLVGNSAVKAKDDSSAVFNRRRSIHLDQPVPLEERRDMLSWRVDHWGGELADELGAFVAWILAMDPQEAKEAMEETGGLDQLDAKLDVELTNPLAEWAEEYLIFDDTADENGKYHQLRIGSLSPGADSVLDAQNFKIFKFAYACYRDWMEANGLKGKELSLKRFKTSLVYLLRDRLELPLPKVLMSQPPYRNRDGAGIPMLRFRDRSKDVEVPGVIRFALQRSLGGHLLET